MYKLIILSIFPIMIFAQNIVYSLQIATFSEYTKAREYKRKISTQINNLFLYKTDSGYWTIRYGKEYKKKDIINIRKKTKYRLLKSSIPVPTSLKKIRNINIRTLNNRKDETSILGGSYQAMVNSQSSIKISTGILPKIIRGKDGNFFIQKIYDVQKEYQKIDTYTFNMRVGERIYIVQFGKFPYSRKANIIFNSKPKNSDINTITLSNDNILFAVKLSDIDKSSSEIEKVLLPILNRGRRNQNIRVKAYRLKK